MSIKTFSVEEKRKIKNCLQEMSNSYTRIEGERDNLKAILERMQDECEIPKKMGRKLGKIFHKRNIAEEVAEATDLHDTYDTVVGGELS